MAGIVRVRVLDSMFPEISIYTFKEKAREDIRTWAGQTKEVGVPWRSLFLHMSEGPTVEKGSILNFRL